MMVLRKKNESCRMAGWLCPPNGKDNFLNNKKGTESVCFRVNNELVNIYRDFGKSEKCAPEGEEWVSA
jgi:hypothetical protein